MNKSRLSDDAKYSIRLASRMTAIAPDTLRVWERRYGVPSPARTAGGGRRYSDADIALLRLVARGLEKGYRPQELLGHSPHELEKMMEAVETPAPVARDATAALVPPSIDGAIDAVQEDDATRLRNELRRAALVLGPRGFVVDYAQPLLSRVGELWARGKLSVRHEHLVSDALATQLRVLLSSYEDLARAPVILLTTLPGELHAMGILMVALYAAVRGAAPRLLGAATPIADIKDGARALGAEIVGVTITAATDARTAEKQVRELRAALPRRVRLWIGGEGGAAISLPEGADRVLTWADVDRGLAPPA